MHTARLLESHVTGVASETGGASGPRRVLKLPSIQLNEHLVLQLPTSDVLYFMVEPTLGEHRRWSQNGHKTGPTM